MLVLLVSSLKVLVTVSVLSIVNKQRLKRHGLLPCTQAQVCDVFLCHRGETKRGLVSHLERRLQRACFDVFADFTMEKGGAAWEKILAKLRGARCIIVVLSSDFEASWYCLEELCIAVERRDFVLPVFLDREPAEWNDATLQSTFKTLCAENPSTDATTVEHWRNALGGEGVGGIAGFVHNHDIECVLSNAHTFCVSNKYYVRDRNIMCHDAVSKGSSWIRYLQRLCGLSRDKCGC